MLILRPRNAPYIGERAPVPQPRAPLCPGCNYFDRIQIWVQWSIDPTWAEYNGTHQEYNGQEYPLWAPHVPWVLGKADDTP